MNWRHALLGGAAVGLAAAPFADLPAGAGARAMLATALLAFVALASPGGTPGQAGRMPRLVVLALCAAAAGVAGGTMRMAALDDGAYSARPGQELTLRGYVAAVPKRSDGEVRVLVAAPAGRIMVSAPEPTPNLPVGSEIEASGHARAPADWESSYLARLGVATVLQARSLRLTGAGRGGLAGLVDGIRSRAEVALGRGTPAPEAALLRGFVLGEDDRIPPATVTEFQRSGLAHLLAVSGQNIVLLAVLAGPLLGLAGVPVRLRLFALLAIIAVYVPVTGAGPSIQRAAIMGAAGIVAMLSGRPQSRWYALLLAATATLVANPRAPGDAGWQLSFAAVAGIALWTAPLREVLAGKAPPGSLRALLAEGAAVTVAATVATAPLMAHDFDAVSITALPANLLALPAIAPVMWLGMLASILGQVPGAPVEPLTALGGLLAAYVAQVAHWFSAPGWAQVPVRLPLATHVVAAYALLGGGLSLLISLAGRRRSMRMGWPKLALPLVAVLLLLAAAAPGGSEASPPALRVTVLDVGQGDAILLQPRRGDPVLVDGGPPGDGLAGKLDALGVDGLGAAIVTHDQLDHDGGIADLLGAFPVRRLVYARAGRALLLDAASAGVARARLSQGSELDSGGLRLEVLWPPRSLLDARGTDPNNTALVLLARWHGFSMLLTADAEAEAVPLDPGPVDVLKVAHHGSEDAGLDGLLDRTAPRLAIVSVGEGNPYGHPAPQTLAELADHRIRTLRTDLDGDVQIDVSRDGWTVH